VNLEIYCEDADTLHELLDWLQRDPDLRGTEIRVIQTAPTAGSMGALSEGLALVSRPEILTALTTTLGVWLGNRFTRTRIRVKHGEIEAEIETRSRRRAADFTRELLDRLSPNDNSLPPA